MKEDKRVEIKDRLREALSVRNMKAVDLVEVSGVPKSAISFYLAGKSKPKADRLYIIAQALDVNEAWLLGYNVPMARSQEAKKNDLLAKLVVKMRQDPDFLDTVAELSELDDEQFKNVKGIISALHK